MRDRRGTGSRLEQRGGLLLMRQGRRARPARAPLATATAVAVILYTYAGYPLLISGLSRRCGGPEPGGQPSEDQLPAMTVLIAAFNEEAAIAARIRNVGAQDYPAHKLRVVVVADGSSDRTAEIALELGVAVLWSPSRAGKSAAVNRGMALCTSELVCLTDANCSFLPGALRALAVRFVDGSVAVVGGAKGVSGGTVQAAGEGLYWRLESRIKAAESSFGCTSGVPGEICAVRRSVFRPIPTGVINDDFHLACDALIRGYQVRHAPDAVSVEPASATVADEFERRTRIAAGTWQTTLAHLRLLEPRRGWTAITFGSHRVLRSVVVPLLLPGLFAGALVRARGSWPARVLLAGQLAVYGSAAAGAVTGRRAFAAPLQFALMNLATLRGGMRYLRGTQPAAWRRVARSGNETEVQR